MGKILINQGRSVPLTFRFVGMLVLMVGMFQIIQNVPETLAILLAIGLSLLIPMLWFSFNILSVNSDTKEVHLGIWVMGYKTGRPKKFGSIEKIYVNKVKTSQAMYSQANQGYLSKGLEYKAFIKFQDGEKYFLTSHPNEKTLHKKVVEIGKKLDLSEGQIKLNSN